MILASIKLLKTEDGGRSNPIYSGYRGQFFFEGNDFDCMKFEIQPEPDGWIQPGESAEVRIDLSVCAWSELNHKIQPGRSFELHEGRKTVAVGTVIAVDQQMQDLER
jgi:translation elongation factor EF-Tu-like GTPase